MKLVTDENRCLHPRYAVGGKGCFRFVEAQF